MNEKNRRSIFLNQNEPVTEDKIFWDPTKEYIFLDRLTENYNRWMFELFIDAQP